MNLIFHCLLVSIIARYSFFSNKNISTGEGGMLVTNNEEFARRVRLLRSHGMTSMSYQRASGHATSYDVVELGYNYRMDDLRASIGLAQLHHLAFEKIQCSRFSCAKILRALRICGDGFVAKLLNRTSVADLRQSFFLNDLAGRIATGKHFRKDVLRNLAADFPAVFRNGMVGRTHRH